MVTELLGFYGLMLVVVFLIKQISKQESKFPPGPPGFPVFGHLPLLTNKSYETLSRWKKTYGPIIGLRFGNFKVMVLHDAKIIKQMANMDQFAGKPRCTMMYNAFCGGDHKGVIFNQNRGWAEQRKFTIKKLGNYGPISPTAIEQIVQSQVSDMLSDVTDRIGQPIQVRGFPGVYYASVILRILFSIDIDKTDPALILSIKHLEETGQPLKVISFGSFIPWLRNLFPSLTHFKECSDGLAQTRAFLRREFENHSLSYIRNRPRDFVDAYMDHVNKTSDETSSFHYEREEVMQVIMDLFAAATDTAASLQSWIFLYLIKYPQVQKKLQIEIDQVIGTANRPTLDDRRAMHYTMALITESLRFSNLGPFGSIRNTLEDTQFYGYEIPKNTIVLSNLYDLHFDPEIWGDPDTFRPERFLDDGGCFVRSENVLQFSLGKRVCPGESFAIDEIFLFTVSFYQKFNCRAQYPEKVSIEHCDGVVVTPMPCEMIVSDR